MLDPIHGKTRLRTVLLFSASLGMAEREADGGSVFVTTRRGHRTGDLKWPRTLFFQRGKSWGGHCLKLAFQLVYRSDWEHTVGMSGILDHWRFPRHMHRLHFSLWLWSEWHTRVDSIKIGAMVGWSPWAHLDTAQLLVWGLQGPLLASFTFLAFY